MNLLLIVINTIIIFVIAVAVHEAGHYLVARFFGYRPRLVFERLKIWEIGAYHPLVVVDAPMTDTALRAFGVAGFAFEFGLCVIMMIVAAFMPKYCAEILTQMFILLYIAWAHFIAYPFYNKGKDSNDFRWLT